MSVIHVALSWTFAIVSAYLVFLLRDRRGSAMLSMSSEYKVTTSSITANTHILQARHKKPMATLACVYAFSATVNAVTRIYLAIVSTNGCQGAFVRQKDCHFLNGTLERKRSSMDMGGHLLSYNRHLCATLDIAMVLCLHSQTTLKARHVHGRQQCFCMLKYLISIALTTFF